MFLLVHAHPCSPGHTQTHTHTHNLFTALLDFVQDYPGEPHRGP